MVRVRLHCKQGFIQLEAGGGGGHSFESCLLHTTEQRESWEMEQDNHKHTSFSVACAAGMLKPQTLLWVWHRCIFSVIKLIQLLSTCTNINVSTDNTTGLLRGSPPTRNLLLYPSLSLLVPGLSSQFFALLSYTTCFKVTTSQQHLRKWLQCTWFCELREPLDTYMYSLTVMIHYNNYVCLFTVHAYTCTIESLPIHVP